MREVWIAVAVVAGRNGGRASECKPEQALVNKCVNLTSWLVPKYSVFSASEGLSPETESETESEKWRGVLPPASVPGAPPEHTTAPMCAGVARLSLMS
jgi:hypothetical protein